MPPVSGCEWVHSAESLLSGVVTIAPLTAYTQSVTPVQTGKAVDIASDLRATGGGQ